jgi:hypothetical protein
MSPVMCVNLVDTAAVRGIVMPHVFIEAIDEKRLPLKFASFERSFLFTELLA